MAVYKPYKKTSSGKEEIKIPYSSINGAPTIPTVNNGTLTIQKNGTKVQTFSANQSGNVTANITVPTKVGELENDSGFTSNAGTITGIKMNSESKGTSGVVDLGTVITAHQDISGKANLSGGNTFTGKQTLNSPASDGYSINAAGYIKGSWLQAGVMNNKGSNTGKVCVFDDSGWIYYRTPAEIIDDGGANAILTIKQNGTFVGTFTANQSDDPVIDITFHLYEHNIYLSCSNTTSTVAPSRAYIYFTIITTDARALNWTRLINILRTAERNAGGYGYIGDPEGNNKSFNASVQKIQAFNTNSIYVTMVYNNSLLGIDNTYDGVTFYSNYVTITDTVRTIL